MGGVTVEMMDDVMAVMWADWMDDHSAVKMAVPMYVLMDETSEQMQAS